MATNCTNVFPGLERRYTNDVNVHTDVTVHTSVMSAAISAIGVVTCNSQEKFDVYEGYMNQKYFVQPGAKYNPLGVDNNFYVDQMLGSGLSPKIQRVSDRMLHDCFTTKNKHTFEEFCEKQGISPRITSLPTLVGKYVFLKPFYQICDEYFVNTVNDKHTIKSIEIQGIGYLPDFFDSHSVSSVRIVRSEIHGGRMIYILSTGHRIFENMISRIDVLMDKVPNSQPDVAKEDPTPVSETCEAKSTSRRPIKFPKVL